MNSLLFAHQYSSFHLLLSCKLYKFNICSLFSVTLHYHCHPAVRMTLVLLVSSGGKKMKDAPFSILFSISKLLSTSPNYDSPKVSENCGFAMRSNTNYPTNSENCWFTTRYIFQRATLSFAIQFFFGDWENQRSEILRVKSLIYNAECTSSLVIAFWVNMNFTKIIIKLRKWREKI